jgi:hypothetical protein
MMQPAPAIFSFGVLESTVTKTGGLMTTPTIRYAGKPNATRAESMQDLLMISSFGFWAVLLGMVPVLTLHGLIGD